MNIHNPSPADVQGARVAAGLTQQQAAEMVHLGSFKRWSEYERGVTPMDTARWELFLIKLGRHDMYRPARGVPVPKPEPKVRSVEAAVAAVTLAPRRSARGPRPGPANRP